MDTPDSLNGSPGHLPQNLSRLSELAENLWWSWTPKARQLFETIDPTLWFLTHHNPVKLLAVVTPDRLARLAENPSSLRQYSAVFWLFDEYRANHTNWFGTQHADMTKTTIAYFSAEFGLHTSIPIYSDGLGILAGYHLQRGQRFRRAARRHRVHVSARVLPPAHYSGRVAGSDVRTIQS